MSIAKRVLQIDQSPFFYMSEDFNRLRGCKVSVVSNSRVRRVHDYISYTRSILREQL